MANKEKTSFEENLTNLETIVKSLESGNVPLDEAIEKFDEAMKLAKLCSDKLKSAEESINKVLTDDGKLSDFKIEE